MELQLERPLLFFDIESTGLNIATDGIVELSFVKALPGQPEPLIKTWKIKPWDFRLHRQIPMNPSASAVWARRLSRSALLSSRILPSISPISPSL